MVRSHCPTLRPMNRLIKHRLYRIVWRCSYCTQTDTNTDSIGFCANLSVSVCVSVSVSVSILGSVDSLFEHPVETGRFLLLQKSLTEMFKCSEKNTRSPFSYSLQAGLHVHTSIDQFTQFTEYKPLFSD